MFEAGSSLQQGQCWLVAAVRRCVTNPCDIRCTCKEEKDQALISKSSPMSSLGERLRGCWKLQVDYQLPHLSPMTQTMCVFVCVDLFVCVCEWETQGNCPSFSAFQWCLGGPSSSAHPSRFEPSPSQTFSNPLTNSSGNISQPQTAQKSTHEWADPTQFQSSLFPSCPFIGSMETKPLRCSMERLYPHLFTKALDAALGILNCLGGFVCSILWPSNYVLMSEVMVSLINLIFGLALPHKQLIKIQYFGYVHAVFEKSAPTVHLTWRQS